MYTVDRAPKKRTSLFLVPCPAALLFAHSKNVAKISQFVNASATVTKIVRLFFWAFVWVSLYKDG